MREREIPRRRTAMTGALPWISLAAWGGLFFGAVIAALGGQKPHEVAKRLGRARRTSLALVVGGSAQLCAFGVGLPFSWPTLAKVSLVSFSPVLLLLLRQWRVRLAAVDADGLLVHVWLTPRRLAWKDIEGVSIRAALPSLLFRERGRTEVLAVSVSPALVPAMLAGVRKRVPLQRLEPRLWSDEDRLWITAFFASARASATNAAEERAP